MKYLVPITRDCTETTNIDVEANSPEEARDKALEEANESPGNFDWTADECSGNQADPYFAGDDDLDAIEETK